ncbi:MAG: DUF1700 domain-containing protein [Pseudomonadota bacterium]
MDKTEYMNALRQALEGLPAAAIEETMWTYERKFLDAMVAGRSEQEIAAGLPKPSLVAAQKKTSVRYDEVKKNFSMGNTAGLFVSLIGLLVFNLFMMIPAIMYFSLLFASYIAALALYVGGIGITAASLSGVSQFNFDVPAGQHVIVDDDDVRMHRHSHRGSVRVDIGPTGIMVEEDDSPASVAADKKTGGQVASQPSPAPAAPTIASASLPPAQSAAPAAAAPAAEPKPATASSADDASRVHVNVDNHVRGYHVWKGLALLLGGIVLFLFSLFMTRYTFIGFKHYLQWNISLLKAPLTARVA